MIATKKLFGRAGLNAGAASLAVALAMISGPAFAQAAATASDAEAQAEIDADDPEEIVVTGSRIARPDLEAVSPVTVVDAEQIELTGTVTLETLLNDLPQVIPGNNRTSNNSGGEPFATLDLRGLGPNRNLILVDGERIAPSSTTGTVDISQIPVGLIQRVDVVTGGATAVYGSDAISGVVNFVLKRDFEGLELSGQTTISESGAGFGFNVQGLFGGNFDDGRGNITVAASYADRDEVGQSRFAYSRTSAAIGVLNDELVVVDNPADLGADGVIIFPGGSGTNPFGTVVQNATNPFRNLATLFPGNFAGADTDCNPATAGVNVNGGNLSFDANGNLRPNLNSTATGRGFCGIPGGNSSLYNFAPDNLLSIPLDRLNLAATARYEFGDRTEARLYTSYTRTEATVNLAPTPAAGGTGFVIPVTSPLIPADLAAALASRTFFTRTAAVTPGAAIGGQFGSAAACAPDANNDGVPDFTCAEQSGANQPFNFNRRFNETGPRIGINESETFQIRGILEHEIDDNWTISGLASFGRSELDSAGIGNINRTAVEQGLAGCRNAAGVRNGPGILPGCVDVDIFGANSLTPAMVTFIQTDTFDTSSFEQVRAAVNLTGSLFELPAGPVGVAVGAEYRKDTGESIPDDAKRRGEIIGFNQANPLGGSITAKEVYGEIRIPLLGGGGGFPDLLAVEGGARFSDYSSVGELFNWKVGAEFAPFSWMRFRGAFNKAARAPSVFELFQNGDQGFPTVVDPCALVAGSRQADRAFCIAQGVPDSVIDSFTQVNSQVQAFAFGNPDLSEENAETFTVGVVLSPDGTLFGGRASLTVDYYDITINDLNAAQGAAFFLNDCYNNQNLAECERIVRGPDGQIQRVNTTRVNSADPLKTSGIDVGLNFVFPLDNLFAGSGGRIRINELFTYVDTYTIGETQFVDSAFGGPGGVTSRYASTLTVAYEEEAFVAQARYVYKSGGIQEDGLFGSEEDAGFRTPRVPDLHNLDISLRWNVDDNFSLTTIVNNVLNETPPQTGSGAVGGGQGNINAEFFTPHLLGRSYTVQALVRF